MADPNDAPAPPKPKLPVLQFLGIFAAVFFLLYFLSYNATVEQAVFTPYLELNTRLSASLLRAFGEEVEPAGILLLGEDTSVEVRRGCDAVEPSALYLAAVVAYPASLLAKVVGGVLGIAFLMLVNFARIVSLFYVNRYRPDLFEVFHLEVWQAAFILLAFGTFLFWAFRVTPKTGKPQG